MITHFAELYKNVLVVAGRVSLLDRRFLQQLTVDLLLSLSNANIDVHLNLRQQ